MQIVYWKTDAIVPYERNARKIPPKAIDKVAASIREYGWRQPIVVDKEGVIICGHARWLAAKKLGLEQAPVHQATNLTPAQVKAYRLMDDRSHEETEWNFDLLGEELLDLRALDFVQEMGSTTDVTFDDAEGCLWLLGGGIERRGRGSSWPKGKLRSAPCT